MGVIIERWERTYTNFEDEAPCLEVTTKCPDNPLECDRGCK